MSWQRGLQPRLLPYFSALIANARRLDGNARVTSAYRSRAEQTRLYRAYLAGRNQFPVAPPGKSLHGQGRALDLHADPATLRRLGLWWESLGGRWGGRFHDPIHFEG